MDGEGKQRGGREEEPQQGRRRESEEGEDDWTSRANEDAINSTRALFRRSRPYLARFGPCGLSKRSTTQGPRARASAPAARGSGARHQDPPVTAGHRVLLRPCSLVQQPSRAQLSHIARTPRIPAVVLARPSPPHAQPVASRRPATPPRNRQPTRSLLQRRAPGPSCSPALSSPRCHGPVPASRRRVLNQPSARNVRLACGPHHSPQGDLQHLSHA